MEQMGLVNVHEIEVHKAAENMPMMTEAQFASFVDDIKMNGQLEPVKVYRGKIVDGRHRKAALSLLGVEHIKYVALPNNMTIDEVKSVVFSSEKRRHQTPTQLAIAAWKDARENGMIDAEASRKHAVPKNQIGRVNKIAALSGTLILDELLKGNHYLYVNFTGKTISTDSLATIIREEEKKKIETTKPKEEFVRDITNEERDIGRKYIAAIRNESRNVQLYIIDTLYAVNTENKE